MAAQGKFVKDQELSFSLLSDPDASATTKYGVASSRGYASRVTFVIDGEGKVRLVDDAVQLGTHGADLVKAIERLKQ